MSRPNALLPGCKAAFWAAALKPLGQQLSPGLSSPELCDPIESPG
ncbi:MAG TPA: hypothetical protein VLB04_05420 [Methanotrichaceae archaeon]|nr:hypothetical protein [Methanotrichaceae archaeon]